MRNRKPAPIGKLFGNLVVLQEAEPYRIIRGNGKTASFRKMRCRCSCGAILSVKLSFIEGGKTKSCRPCGAKTAGEKLIIHGHHSGGKSSPEYRSWRGMITRCFDPSSDSWATHGGRGISVCQRWRSGFQNFLADMGSRPSPHHSIDRIDNDGNYEPSNCRWATRSQQMRNTRTNRLITAHGETMCLSSWAERIGISPNALYMRLRRWSIERAISTPARARPDLGWYQ
jgi:hypothetical protein